MLTDDELRAIAEPILEILRKMEEQSDEMMMEVPKLHLVVDPKMNDMIVGDIEISAEDIKQIEEYLQC
ncbi:hypothetical protein, partial [Dubosiella newyorkensis]